MVQYALLILFSLASIIFIINSHYRWTYFFAISQFLLFIGIMFTITGQWQRAVNFSSTLFIVFVLFHRIKIHFYKQPLLISDFFLVIDWRNWETLLHYRQAFLLLWGYWFCWLMVYSVGKIPLLFLLLADNIRLNFYYFNCFNLSLYKEQASYQAMVRFFT